MEEKDIPLYIKLGLKTQYAQIEWLLQNDERCRNDDKWLTWRFMGLYTKMYIKFEDFAKIPAFANIQKLRQRIQNKEHRFPPTDPKVLKMRGITQGVMREFMASNPREKEWNQ